MATIISPDSSCAVAKFCETDNCPRMFTNCGRDCFEIVACKTATFDIVLGCDRYTGEELEIADITALNIKFYHDSLTGVVIDKAYSLANNATFFTPSGQFGYSFVLPGTETKQLPSGIMYMDVEITTAQGTWVIYKTRICVEVELLAPPVLYVTGAGDKTTQFTIAAGLVNIWLHNSDIIHGHKTWDRFVVTWGDGTTDPLDVSALQPPDALTWTLAHTYAASGTYTINIEGFSDYDPADPCDVELYDCGAVTICVQI